VVFVVTFLDSRNDAVDKCCRRVSQRATKKVIRRDVIATGEQVEPGAIRGEKDGVCGAAHRREDLAVSVEQLHLGNVRQHFGIDNECTIRPQDLLDLGFSNDWTLATAQGTSTEIDGLIAYMSVGNDTLCSLEKWLDHPGVSGVRLFKKRLGHCNLAESAGRVSKEKSLGRNPEHFQEVGNPTCDFALRGIGC
jgi:hypothetical protein